MAGPYDVRMSESPADHVSDEAWAPDLETRTVAREYFCNVLPPPDLGLLTQGIATGPDSDADPLAHIYDEALVDLVRLLDEFRFGASVGALYARGVRDEVRRLRDGHSQWPNNVGMSPKVLALLSPYTQNTNSPDKLIFEPNAKVSGERVLGGWWAAQLLDSAIIRGISVLDRVAILLHCIVRQVEPKRMPAFRSHHLEKLSGEYASDPEWATLLGLAQGELFQFVKDMRDGHVHRRRLPAELHGDFVTSGTDADGRYESTRGLDPDVQWALATAFFNDVICKALDAAGALIARRTVPLGERLA